MKKSTINKVSISFLLGLISCLYSSDDDLRPIEHKCPITLDVMRDPVVASDGHTYEKHAIEQHFGIRATSPSTGLVISKNLIPNHALKKMIKEWKPGRQEEPPQTIGSCRYLRKQFWHHITPDFVK
jgi:hypothetical protein